MHQLGCVLQHVVDGLNDAPFAKHDFVPHGHEPVLHVRPNASNQMCAVLKEHVEELRREISPVGEKFPIECLCQDSPDLRVPVVHVGPREAERDDLAPVVTDKVQLEAVAPSHRPLAVSGQSSEHLVGIAPQVVAHRHHR